MIATLRRDPIALASIAGLALFGLTIFLLPPLTVPLLGLIALTLAAAITYARPVTAMAAWLLLVETTPEMWLSDLIGRHELIIALLKSAGLAITILAALRDGARFDKFNPAGAFALMFLGGIIHGFWPGLTLTSSFRSLIGSAAPFAAGYLRLRAPMRSAIIRCTILGPSVTVTFGAILAILHIRALYGDQFGALRLAASSDPAFLGGFAMIGIFAGLIEFLRTGRSREFGWIAANFLILIATGARSPLAMAALVTLAALATARSDHLPPTRRIGLIAVGGIVLGAVLMAATALHFIRVIDLLQRGDASNLSNRQLIWPYFEAAIARSPWIGWGVGAGKVVVTMKSPIATLLGTNAAHNEYLRIATEGGILGALLLFGLIALWLQRGTTALPPGQRRLIRLAFLAFAVQSFTDNTLIATTSLVFFTWARAVFVNHDEGPPT